MVDCPKGKKLKQKELQSVSAFLFRDTVLTFCILVKSLLYSRSILLSSLFLRFVALLAYEGTIMNDYLATIRNILFYLSHIIIVYYCLLIVLNHGDSAWTRKWLLYTCNTLMIATVEVGNSLSYFQLCFIF